MIKLMRNGDILYTQDFDNGQFILSNDNIMIAYAEDTEIEDDFTVRSIFKMIEKYPTLKYIQPFLDDYIDTISKLPGIGCRKNCKSIKIFHHISLSESNYDINSRFEEIENSKYSAMIFTYTKNSPSDKPASKHFENFYDALFETEEPFKTEFDNNEHFYSMSFVPIEEYLDAPVIIGDSLFHYNKKIYVNQEKTMDGTNISTSHNDTHPNLFDIINAVLNEITFHGNEHDKKKELENLIESIDSIDDDK